MTETLYKVLVDGESCHGGELVWSLPTDGKPGDWMRYDGVLEIYVSGIHLTKQFEKWLKVGCTIYEAEAEDIKGWDWDKCVCRAARLIRQIETPSWWIGVEKFIRDEINTCPWFSKSGGITLKHRLFETRSAAYSAARSAAYSAAYWAALQCVMTTVCKELDIAPEHRQLAADVWSIWRAGYCCLGKVGDEFIVYERVG